MAKEKVTVVTGMDGHISVHRTRRSGADEVVKRTPDLHKSERRSLGQFIEGQSDSGGSQGNHVREVEVQD